MTNRQTLHNEERRNHERLIRKSSLSYRTIDDLSKNDLEHSAELCDFSGGGVRFISNQALKKNTQLVLNLTFPGWTDHQDTWVPTGNTEDISELNAIGAVMWCSEDKNKLGQFEIGVHFTGRIKPQVD